MLPIKKNSQKSIPKENEVDLKNLELLVETILLDIKKRKSKQNLKKKIRINRKKLSSKFIEENKSLFE